MTGTGHLERLRAISEEVVWLRDVAKDVADLGRVPAALVKVLRKRLTEWVNGSFDKEGGYIYPEPDPGSDPICAAIQLPSGDRRVVLKLATAVFPLPASPDWSNDDDALALRTHLLASLCDAFDKQWGCVQSRASAMADVDWRSVLHAQFSSTLLFHIAQCWVQAEAFQSAHSLGLALVENMRSQIKAQPEKGIENRSLLEIALEVVAHTDFQTDAIAVSAVEAGVSELLEIDRAATNKERKNAEKDNDTSSFGLPARWLGNALVTAIEVARKQGKLAEAEELCIEYLTLRREIATFRNNAHGRFMVSKALTLLGDIALQQGKLSEAETALEECASLWRGLPQEALRDPEQPEFRNAYCAALSGAGRLTQAQGNLVQAESFFKQCLDIARELASSSATPESKRNLQFVLSRLADIASSQGRQEEANACIAECAGLPIGTGWAYSAKAK